MLHAASEHHSEEELHLNSKISPPCSILTPTRRPRRGRVQAPSERRVRSESREPPPQAIAHRLLSSLRASEPSPSRATDEAESGGVLGEGRGGFRGGQVGGAGAGATVGFTVQVT